jgi:hypothetical protein
MNTSLNSTPVIDETITYNLEDSIKKEIETTDVNVTPIMVPTLAASHQPLSKRMKKKTIPFWTEDPNILVKPAYISEFFPVDPMTFNQKLNAISRTVIVLTMISYIFTQNSRIINIAAFTLISIFLLYYTNNQSKNTMGDIEGFERDNDMHGRPIKFYNRHGTTIENPKNLDDIFDTSTPSNPLANVLLTDYDYNPDKKPAPPSFTSDGSDSIIEQTKNMVQELNPGQPQIVKKLYNDVNTNLELEQSMRQFYSTSNTTIPNDQAGFAQFCYGNMVSGKEGNDFAAVRDNPRYNLH